MGVGVSTPKPTRAELIRESPWCVRLKALEFQQYNEASKLSWMFVNGTVIVFENQ